MIVSTACSPSNQVIADIDIAISAAEVAAPFVTSNPLILAYVNQAGSALQLITAELATTDTAAQKSSKVLADLASIVLPDISGLPLNVQGLVKAINAALQVILHDFSTPTANSIVAHSKNVGVNKVNKADLQKLANLQARARILVQSTAPSK